MSVRRNWCAAPDKKPRYVRPSWLTVTIDGRERLATGPRSILVATLAVRDRGNVLPLLHVSVEGGTVTVIDKRTGTVLFSEVFVP